MFDMLVPQLQQAVRSIQWKQDEHSNRINQLQKHVEELYRRIDMLGKKEETTEAVNKDPKIEGYLPDIVKKELGIGMDRINFADHKSLNLFFKEFCFVENCWSESTGDSTLEDFLDGLESSAITCKECGEVSILDILKYLGYNTEDFDSDVKDELDRYAWFDDSFDYQINVYHPDENNVIGYYVVFSSAPVYRGTDD